MFSTADWDHPFWTNKQHMAVTFARHGYRVLYVESLGLRRPSLNRRDLRRMTRRLLRGLPLARRLLPGIWGVSPLVLPVAGSAAQAVNRRVLEILLRWHLRALGMRRPLVWTYNPTVAGLCTTLPHCGIVYHCVDDLRGSPGIDAHAIDKGEAALAAVADLCFVTSRPLQNIMEPSFKKTVYEPNVCDPDFFAAARTGLDEPSELSRIPRPRALFIGALSEYKVDFELLSAVADLLPGVQFVLVGPVGEGQPDSRRPPILPNIHVIGAQPYERLPYFMANADLALLPIPRNRYTNSMFPMKFFEYLSAGLPVVGTNTPALEEFKDLYFTADTVHEFAQRISSILSGTQRDSLILDAACDRYSWKSRFSRMEKEISVFFFDELLHRP